MNFPVDIIFPAFSGQKFKRGKILFFEKNEILDFHENKFSAFWKCWKYLENMKI